METINQQFPWLELLDRPAFCAKGGTVIAVNNAAQHHMLQPGTDIRDIVTEQRETYESFESGSLYLTVTVGNIPCSACVTRTKECDIFILQQDADSEQLQALALAAQQLRIPLSNVMTVTDRLLANLENTDNSTQQQASQINQGLFQLLRIISNMSDSGSYKGIPFTGMQTVNLTEVFREVMEKSQTISENAGIRLSYTGPQTPVLGLANAEKLERAVYNLLSNALKFAPEDSTIEAKLTQKEKLLSFTICNENTEEIIEPSFWNRYRRSPAIEDSRYGLGLGMTLVSAVAAAHKGTVLIDHPDAKKTRVTMTIALIQDNGETVRSPIVHMGDYAGGRDKALLELAEILPPHFYENIN